MSSPKVFLEELSARRAELCQQLELMESHIANPQRTPSFGTTENSKSTTEDSIARVKEQIAQLDEQIDRVNRGNV